ncbi:VWA domain-containing protein [Calidithermus timidus]|uniref:VWA domain-containing protein n=1 Tax=Calidithermus timidus TaxID=307124 RepID=UPI000365928D|nr:VWA domain-containing protein [Calidithermus timidus]
MLWLRCAVIALLLLAFLGPSLPLQTVRTVVLLDQSPSAREGVARVVGTLPQLPIGARSRLRPEGNRHVRYLAFAERVQEVASATARREDLGEGTDINAALLEAQRLEPDRIVLLSDGLSQGEVLPVPTPIYAFWIAPSPRISLSLLPPTYPVHGETVEVRVLLESTADTTAHLLIEGPAGRQERQVQVKAGRQSFGYRFALERPATVRARVESSLGQDSAQVQVSPADKLRVWVLGDEALARYLEVQGFAVERRSRVELPIQADVVALGVSARDLSEAEIDALQDFLNQGGSLLWTATPRGLFFGGWERSSLSEAIPLEPLEHDGGVGLVLVLDVSGSMLQDDKLELAVTGALELIRSAREQDYVGVVAFSSNYRWVFRPRRMTPQGRKAAESLLLAARAGGGTLIGGAYTEAVRALEPLPVEDKRILVMTDGQVADPIQPVLNAAAQGQQRKIFTSSVALGADADQGFLRELAQQGGGSFWYVPSPGDLPRFFLEEAQRQFRREALEGSFALVTRPHPLTRDLQPPPLSVVLPAKARPWASGLLYAQEGAVLAVGESGRGRVAALATDLSRSWKDWRGASGFLGSLLRWLSQTPARPRVQATRGEEGVRVLLEGQFERPALRYAGKTQDFLPIGPLRYEARLPYGARGEAAVLEAGVPRLSLTLPALPEWRLEDGRAKLRALAEASGGRLLSDLAELSALPQRKALELRSLLVALALVLFVLERYLEWRRVGVAGS